MVQTFIGENKVNIIITFSWRPKIGGPLAKFLEFWRFENWRSDDSVILPPFTPYIRCSSLNIWRQDILNLKIQNKHSCAGTPAYFYATTYNTCITLYGITLQLFTELSSPKL